MAIQDIQNYIEANGGRFRLEILLDQLRQAGYPENEIQEALRLRDIPVPPPLKSKSSARKVFTILGIIAAVISGLIVLSVFLSFSGTRPLPYGSDTRRIADINQIKLALELYYDANGGEYPENLNGLAAQNSCGNGVSCLAVVPRDPASGTPYHYERRSNCGYYLSANLEDSSNYNLSYDANPGNSMYDVQKGPQTADGQCPKPAPLPSPVPQGKDSSVKNPFAGLSGRSLRLVAPNGGERLCIGKDFVVKWESGGLKTVNFYIRQGSQSAIYPIGVYPADFNETSRKGSGEFVWRVGTTSGGVKLQEGYAYEVIANSTDGGSLIADTSDNIFSVLTCEG